MRFDLHVHSNYSDGHDDVKTILKAARKRGLDGIAITDHDSLGGSRAARRIIEDLNFEMIIIPGAEVTTSRGHLIALGVNEIPKRGLTPEETTEAVHALGGITVVPHPYHPLRHAIGRIPNCDAVEVYNSKHLFGIANARARLGAKRRRLPMVAGSDSHFAATVGLGVTRIEAEDAMSAVEAIRLGKTRIEGRRTPPRYFIGNTFKEIYKGVRKTVRRI